MEPISGAARAPLNRILGSEANIRILRVLTQHGAPLGRADASRYGGLTPQGGRKAIARLVETGIVEMLGSGSTQLVQLRADHPLTPALASLFEAERSRFSGFLTAIRETLEYLDPAPVLVWVEGAVAESTDGFGEPLILSVLADPREADTIVAQLRDRLKAVEREFALSTRVRALTGEELASNLMDETGNLLPFWRPDPDEAALPET